MSKDIDLGRWQEELSEEVKAYKEPLRRGRAADATFEEPGIVKHKEGTGHVWRHVKEDKEERYEGGKQQGRTRIVTKRIAPSEKN